MRGTITDSGDARCSLIQPLRGFRLVTNKAWLIGLRWFLGLVRLGSYTALVLHGPSVCLRHMWLKVFRVQGL